MKTKKEGLHSRAAYIILILTIISIVGININKTINDGRKEIQELKDSFSKNREQQAFMMAQLDLIEEYARIGAEVEPREIIVTNYGLWDGKSSDTTASKLKISDFDLNAEGFFTHKGYVVVATANLERLNEPLRKGYVSHKLGDIIMLEIKGKQYKCKVLDVCGSCYGMPGEEHQRYDIFTSENVIGKTKGEIIE